MSTDSNIRKAPSRRLLLLWAQPFGLRRYSSSLPLRPQSFKMASQLRFHAKTQLSRNSAFEHPPFPCFRRLLRPQPLGLGGLPAGLPLRAARSGRANARVLLLAGPHLPDAAQVLLPAGGVATVHEPAVGAVGVHGTVDADEVKNAFCLFVEFYLDFVFSISSMVLDYRKRKGRHFRAPRFWYLNERSGR
jgi:hypothetical protein